jgi:hypothetical protein
MEVAPARRFDATDGAQIFAAAGDGGRGYRALRDQTAFAVEVAQNQFEQLRALRDACGQLPPIGVVDQQRQMAQRPRPVGGIAGGAIGDPGLAQMPVGGCEPPLDVGGRKGRKGVEEPGPDRPRRAVGADIFIGNARQARIIARPLRHPALARTGPAFLTISLAGRHSDSRGASVLLESEPRLRLLVLTRFLHANRNSLRLKTLWLINVGAASSSRGSTEIQ